MRPTSSGEKNVSTVIPSNMDKEVRVNAEPDGQPGDGSPWVAGQSEKTLAQQSDEVILLHLSDYMATSGGGTINGALIEAAQEASNELMEIMSLSEDELAERDDLNSPLAQKAKAKAQSAKDLREAQDRAREDLKQQREEERREEAKKEWLESTQSFGGKSWDGKALWDFLEWAKDPKNLDAVDQEMIAQGYKPEEVKTMRQKFEEARRLKQQEAIGNPPLTEAQKKKLKEYENDPDLKVYTKAAENRYNAREMELSKDKELSAKLNTVNREEKSQIRLEVNEEFAQHEENYSVASDHEGSLLSKVDFSSTNLIKSDVDLSQHFTDATNGTEVTHLAADASMDHSNSLIEDFKAAKAAIVPLDQDHKETKVVTQQLAVATRSADMAGATF